MRYDITKDHIELSVRELCQMALLSGDILALVGGDGSGRVQR